MAMASITASSARRLMSIMSAAFAAMLVVTGCSGGSGGTASQSVASDYGDPVSGGELKFGFAVSVSSLDPLRGGAGSDHIMLYTMYDRLINFTDDIQAAPGLAESFEFTDPQTLVLNLVEGVTFSDGTPFNAEAVKANLDRARTAEISNVRAELASVAEVQVTDEHTVTIKLTHPDSSIPLILGDRAGMMASPAVIAQGPDALAQNPVGTGPFVLESFAPGDSLVVVKNPSYWQDGKPYLDKITFKVISAQQTLLNSIGNGESNFTTRLVPDAYATLKSNSQLIVDAKTTLAVEGCYMNAAKAPLDNVKVRQAIAYAIDYENLGDQLSFGAGYEVAKGILPEDYWAYPEGYDWPYEHDPEKAKQLLEEAGASNIEISVVNYNAPGQQRKAEIIQSYLKEVGITMNISMQEVGAATQAYAVKQEYNMYCAQWTGRPDPSMTFQNLLAPNGFFNGGKYSEPGAEEILAAGNEVIDPDERAKAFEGATKYMADTLLYMPMVILPYVTAYAPEVQGYEPTLTGKPDVSFLWIDPSKG